MEVWDIFLGIFIVLLGIPVGLILKFLTSDETKPGKPYFMIVFASSFLLALISLVAPFDTIMKKTMFFGFLFMGIVGFISWYDRKSFK